MRYFSHSVINWIQIWRIWRPQLRWAKFWSFFLYQINGSTRAVIPPSHQSCAHHDCLTLKKFCPAWRERGQLTVFAPMIRHQCVFMAFSLRPISIHHAPYHAQHHARITLELRPLRLYRDQSDCVARTRRFHHAQAMITTPQLRAYHAFGAT